MLFANKADKLMILILLTDVAVLTILLIRGLVLLPSLLPVAATDDRLKQLGAKHFTVLDRLTMGNVQVNYFTFA